jgi:manganese-dependent inorganic pyrophosphatase
MDVQDKYVLAKAGASYDNVIDTVNGTVLVGDPAGKVVEGGIVIGSGSVEQIERSIHKGDVVIVSNRSDSQLAAIEMEAGCVVVCAGAQVSRTIRMLAEEKGCLIVGTPNNTYVSGQIISQAAPIRYYMLTEGLMTFNLNTPVEAATKLMASVRHRYFPVLDDDGKYLGVLSRRNLLNLRRKQLILVDHNEKSQAAEGLEEAEVLEIIDHHRIGWLETDNPVYFRNMPVGCTCTIIYQMYQENGVEIDPATAGLMLSAILSDTLMFRSPTCTEIDKEYAKELAEIAGVDLKKTGEAMFEAGEDLSGKTGDDLLHGDYKIFTAYDKRFGVSQSMFLSPASITKAIGLSSDALQEMPRAEDTAYSYYLLTDITKESSRVLCAGNGAEDLLRAAFGLGEDDELQLKGVVSRKKQFVPAIIEELRRESE